MSPAYQIIGAVIGYLIAVGFRFAARSRFWKYVADKARAYLDDPTIPIDDPRNAAERALIEAQRSQLDAIQRNIERGGNGFRNGH